MFHYRPGELDQRIEIFRQVKTDDGQGGQDVNEVLQYTLWAKVIVKGGTEVVKYEKVEAVATYIFVVRQSKSLVIQDDDIIKWDGVKFNIRSPLQRSPRRMYLEIEAEKGVAQ